MPNQRLQRQRAAHRHNTGHAPVLKALPAEILNRIYGILLGGNTIHIYVKDGEVGARLCKASDADATKKTEIVDFGRRHTHCDSYCCVGLSEVQKGEGYNNAIKLLLAHRMFYTDAAALPFALNTFVFPSYETFLAFKNDEFRKAFQLDSLTSVVLNTGRIPFAPGRRVSSWPMHGLENLTVFYQAYEKHPGPLTKMEVEGVRSKLEKVLQEFRQGKIKNVKVCVTSENPYTGAHSAIPEVFGQMCAVLEAKVLGAK